MDHLNISVELENGPNETIRFFYESFRFSQGDENLQRLMFHYVKMSGVLHKLPDVNPNFFEKIRPPSDSIHQNFTSDIIKKTFEDAWLRFGEIIDGKVRLNSLIQREQLVKMIALGIKKRDDLLHQKRKYSYYDDYIKGDKNPNSSLFKAMFDEIKNIH